MLQWLRRRFVTGLVLTVPLVVSVVAIVWLVQFADARTSGLTNRLLGRPVPYVGILAAATAVLLVGILARNVVGRRVVGWTEALLLHVPVFRTVYSPVKQLLEAFSPDNTAGFKRVVLIDHPVRGPILGFLTREFEVDRGAGPEAWLAVYVPTNHLYLGDVVVCSREHAAFPDVTVEQGIRIFLTGGVGLPGRVELRTPAPAGADEPTGPVSGPGAGDGPRAD
ncbi:MAG: DUF502 domain-containing protein [Vicinamibacterales bacterium]